MLTHTHVCCSHTREPRWRAWMQNYRRSLQSFRSKRRQMWYVHPRAAPAQRLQVRLMCTWICVSLSWPREGKCNGSDCFGVWKSRDSKSDVFERLLSGSCICFACRPANSNASSFVCMYCCMCIALSPETKTLMARARAWGLRQQHAFVVAHTDKAYMNTCTCWHIVGESGLRCMQHIRMLLW